MKRLARHWRFAVIVIIILIVAWRYHHGLQQTDRDLDALSK